MFVMDKETNQPLEGTHTLVFTIYPEDSNSSVWQESQEIELNYGLIKTSLGKNESLPTDLDPLNNNYFLGIKIGDDIELTPRKKISPNPFSISSIYSQTSGDSQTLEGSQIGEEEGDIMLLGSGWEVDTAFLPGDLSYLGPDIDLSSETNLEVSGSLLNLSGDTLSINEGTLTDGAICTYSTTEGLVCNTTVTASGDITEVIAGSGLTGGATTEVATLNIGAGTGITVNANSISTTLGTSIEKGELTDSGTLSFDWLDSEISDSLTITNLSGTNTGDQTITLTGDITGSGTGSFTTTIGSNKILESMLKSVNSPTDEYYLTYEATTGDFWMANCSWRRCFKK